MIKNKKLFIVYDNLDIGGIQTKIIDLVNFLNLHHPEIKITICLLYYPGRFSHKIDNKNQIIIPTLNRRKFFGRYWWFQKFEFSCLSLWLAYQIATRRPNYILSFISRPSILTIIAKTLIFWHWPRMIIGEDCVTSKNLFNEPVPFMREPLIKKTYPFAHKILVQTPVQKKDLIDNFNIKPQKIIVSPNWLPLEFNPNDCQSKNKKDIDILYIGRLDPQKNINLFIDIVHQIIKIRPKLVVKIIGQGREEVALKEKVTRLKMDNQITFLPPTKNPKLYYHRSKVFLLSSIYEGFPLTILEAIACNCFPISPNLNEVSPFFKNHQPSFIYSTISQAVKIILHQLDQDNPSPLLREYQQIIFKNQNIFVTQYLNEIIQ